MKQFYYGGQAVIEGVLIRGSQTAALAVRRSDGLMLSFVKFPLLGALLS